MSRVAALTIRGLRRASCPPPCGTTPVVLAKIAPGEFVAAFGLLSINAVYTPVCAFRAPAFEAVFDAVSCRMRIFQHAARTR